MQHDELPDDDFRPGRSGSATFAAPRRPRPAYRRPFVARMLRVPDAWRRRRGGRSRRAARRPALTPTRAERSPRRTRPIAAAVLLAALTAGWLVAGHRSRGAGSSAALASPSSVATTRPATTTTADACRRAVSSADQVHCLLAGVRLDVRTYPAGTAAAAYRQATGVAAAPHTGPPACERGAPDERAWSAAGAPDVAVGRYRCAIENGHAAMWWTHGDRLAHAVTADGDLAALFAWWRTHPVE